ncbi:hypothetical protein HN011_002221 [Eciton burchellii]|nr:hypothetical protein HN011_002221 [Eciton burchellii]
MTRFARAKGSKASNEKLPNEATPWHLMKQQMEENKYKASLEKKISVKELLKDEKDTYSSNISENNNWAEFDDNKSNLPDNKQKYRHKNLASNKIQNDDVNHIMSENSNKAKELEEKTEDTEIKTMNSKKNRLSNKKKQNINNSPPNEKESNISQDNKYPKSVVLSKRQKRNRKRKLEMTNNDAKRFKINSHSKTKEEKFKEKGEYKRRKPDTGITKIIINGIETEIVKYDGFPIKKEDANRLIELKQKMIMKGIPKSEIDIAIKLERRKAEKALARTKKLVCFHCRKSGHNLSDCPEIGSEEINTGICFKCGSTEHTHFECKVNKDSTYRYAKCFICREQGHIAAQCPDNPRGVYPHGGCCKICGAVTHLKKDCPDLKVKEDSAITVEKMDNTAVESLQKDRKEEDENNVTLKKIIRF